MCIRDRCYAVGGIDLSQTTDLTAASVVIEKEGVLYAFTQFFMPKNRLETLQATDGVPYDIFVKKGIITLSGDNYVNYKDVFNWYVWLLETYGIRVLKIGYDRYSAQYLVDDLKNYGFHTDDVYPVSYTHLCGACVYLSHAAGAAGWNVAPGLSCEMPAAAEQ